jgi:hypothetical protein
MVVIEDGYSNYIHHDSQKRTNTIKGKIKTLVFGNNIIEIFGKGNHCEKIILTGLLAIIDLDIQKKVEYVQPLSLWNKASEEKKNYIISIFDVKKEFISKMQNTSIILLTQPIEEIGINEEKKISLYKKMIATYNLDKIVIKVHPRDKTIYSDYFPNYFIFDKPIPTELFSLMGIRFNKVLTYHSSAALSFPYDIEIIHYGFPIEVLNCKKDICLLQNRRILRNINRIM